MDIKIGDLNKYITIVTISNTQNENGFPVEVSTDYCNCHAKVINLSGNEVFKSGADYSKTITKFIVKYRHDKEIKSDMKIKYNSKLYNIVYVNNIDEANKFVELTSEVIQNG